MRWRERKEKQTIPSKFRKCAKMDYSRPRTLSGYITPVRKKYPLWWFERKWSLKRVTLLEVVAFLLRYVCGNALVGGSVCHYGVGFEICSNSPSEIVYACCLLIKM